MALARADMKTGATICSGSSIIVSWKGGQLYLELVLLGLSSRAGVEEIDSENLKTGTEYVSIIVMDGWPDPGGHPQRPAGAAIKQRPNRFALRSPR